MLNMYGHDTTPFLEEAWNAIVGEAESTARAHREKQNTSSNNSKAAGAGARRKAKQQSGPVTFAGNAMMLTLNGVTCVALFSAWRSGLPHSFSTQLTWVCFAAFCYMGLWRIKDGAALICFPLACLFNPFYQIRLTNSFWNIIDVGSLLILVALSLSFLANPKK